MPSLKWPAFEALEAGRLPELIRSRGPCITIYLPPYRPGATSPRAQHAPLKEFIHTAAQRLSQMHVDEATTEGLLAPLKAFVGTVDADNGFHWTRAIFRSPDVLLTSFIRSEAPSNVTVGERFQILPALGDLQVPAQFYILKLSKKSAALLRGGLKLERVKLPGKTAETIEEFLEMEPPDHDLENRGSTGGSAPGRRIRFGTSSEREDQQIYLADFYKSVDRAVRDVVRDPKTPVVLAGVTEDADVYRSIASWATIVPGGIAAGLSDAEMLEQANALIRDAWRRKAAQSFVETKEKFAATRYLADPEAIVRAAQEGRVGRLFIGTPADDEALANRAAIETLRNSGEAELVPRDAIPERTGIVAILRY